MKGEPLPFSDTSFVRDSNLYLARLAWPDKANSLGASRSLTDIILIHSIKTPSVTTDTTPLAASGQSSFCI